MNTVIIYGPEGCGKTYLAEEFRRFFGCKRIVDDWYGKTPIKEGDLALTVLDPSNYIKGFRPVGSIVGVYSYDEARQAMRQ